jgi:alkylation response protein AidB-like acyl-CoA dehydrogenase
MGHYRTNLRDIEFNLFEAYRTQDYMGDGPYHEMDEDTARHILLEVERLALNEFAESFVDADRNPPMLVDGEVHLPESLKASLRAFYDGGWDTVGLPPALGGVGAPPSLRWAVQELLVGANPAAFFYVVGTLMANVVYEVGTPEQVERFVKPMLANHWGSTMVLTEPDAGSDVGAGTTRASRSATACTTSRASSASSRRGSMTSATTSSTWCWPVPRVPAPAPRACRCSSSPSSW